MLLVVADSAGSSPGRAGYKMAVGADGALAGSIGGGVMEVRLVEQARAVLSESRQVGIATGFSVDPSALLEQVHRKNAATPSGMICSGQQTVIFRTLTRDDAKTVGAVVDALRAGSGAHIMITSTVFNVLPPKGGTQNETLRFERQGDDEFIYTERLGPKNNLYIIGGGHCALALSELMSKMDFRITIFDDRPDLNTIRKNSFADEITIIDSYENIAGHIPAGEHTYVVVMTLGYRSDETVIRGLFEMDFKYFGVLGSKAKMRTLLSALRRDGLPEDRLSRIRTPIGIQINSRTPEEIAVSIAAEIIAVKNN